MEARSPRKFLGERRKKCGEAINHEEEIFHRLY